MPTTTVFDGDGTDWTAAVRALGARTDNAGAAVIDLAADEDRLINHILTEGFLTADAFVVSDGSTGMEVDVGSGTAKADIYVVEGDDTGQHPYLVRMDDATVTVTLDAGDADPRIDEIYLVVRDATFDGGSVTEAQIGYRKGDAAASPSAPGPDSAWDAEVLLASIDVAASASTVAAGDITDERAGASFTSELQGSGSGLDADLLDGVQLAALMGSLEVDGSTEAANELFEETAVNTLATVNLSIPAGWGSWRCEAYATFGYNTNGVDERVSFWIDIDGTDQQQLEVDSTSERTPGSVGGRRTGMTTTGSRAVKLEAQSTSDSHTAEDIFLYARAVRTG